MFRLHHRLASDALLASVVCLFIGCAVSPSTAQEIRSKSHADDTADASTLSPSFEALETAWIESRNARKHRTYPRYFDSDRDGTLRRGAPAEMQQSWRPHRRDAWSAGTVEAEARVRPPRNRISKALEHSQLATGQLSVRSAASASQAQARQAIVDALARTPLGRALGRVFYIHRDDEVDGDDNGPGAWSKAVPRLNPRLNARTRTVAMTFVWRF
jgi:hypothetical protein